MRLSTCPLRGSPRRTPAGRPRSFDASTGAGLARRGRGAAARGLCGQRCENGRRDRGLRGGEHKFHILGRQCGLRLGVFAGRIGRLGRIMGLRLRLLALRILGLLHWQARRARAKNKTRSRLGICDGRFAPAVEGRCNAGNGERQDRRTDRDDAESISGLTEGLGKFGSGARLGEPFAGRGHLGCEIRWNFSLAHADTVE